MTNSYSTPLTYGPTNMPVEYAGMQPQKKKDKSIPFGIAGLAVGGGVAGYMGYRKNPYMESSGSATDSFTKTVYEKFANTVTGDEKTLITQRKELLKEVDKAKTADNLKSLLENKQMAAKDALGSNYDDIVNNLSETNLTQNKSTIKNSLKTQETNSLQKMKNWITACWDKDKKKFTKADSVTDDAFKAIESATNGAKTRLVTKYAAIGALTTGVVAYIAHKIISNKKQNQVPQK